MIKLLLCCAPFIIEACSDLEVSPAPFILETKQIKIIEYPNAFNPSIIRWHGKLLMSFRNISNPKDSYNSSDIGLAWLDDDFQITGKPQILYLNKKGTKPYHRAEDARLIEVAGHLFMIYSDNEDPIITKGGYRVYIIELVEQNGKFIILSKERLDSFEGVNPNLREKNWTPFNYKENLLLSYSLNPHLVFKPAIGTGECETFALSNKSLQNWTWGELRGGTQALKIGNRYLTFFHTAIHANSDHSDGKDMLHYFMGASTFESEPPFAMTHISPEPIIGKGFFTGTIYKQYWGSWRGIFPCGFIFDNTYIYVVYGRQNHEIWVVKLEKRELLDSLIPIH